MFNLGYFANSFFPLDYWAKLGEEAVVITPPNRTVFIKAESREVLIPAENRSVTL